MGNRRSAALRTLATVALFACGAQANAADYRSVSTNAAVLYDAPSKAAKPLFVVSRNYPVEVIVNLEAWVKIRDHAGALAWIEKGALAESRMVLVTASSAEVRAKPDDAAPLVFVAAQNVVLELVEASAGGWVRVRHPDGTSGFVRVARLWGV